MTLFYLPLTEMSILSLGALRPQYPHHHALAKSLYPNPYTPLPCLIRWDDTPQPVRLERLPHTPLTPHIHLWDIDFQAVAASSGPSLQGITPAAECGSSPADHASADHAPADHACTDHASTECGSSPAYHESAECGSSPADYAPADHVSADNASAECGSSPTDHASLECAEKPTARSAEECPSSTVSAHAASGSSAAVTASVLACGRGILNSAALWFTLHLDDHTHLSTAPGELVRSGPTPAARCGAKAEREQGHEDLITAPGARDSKAACCGGTAEQRLLPPQQTVQEQGDRQGVRQRDKEHGQLGCAPLCWGQALLYLDSVMPVQPGQVRVVIQM